MAQPNAEPHAHAPRVPSGSSQPAPDDAEHAGWLVSTRSVGEVLTTELRGDDLRIVLFSMPSLATALEINLRIGDLLDTRTATQWDAYGPRGIPGPLHRAAVMLIDLVGELEQLSGARAGALAFYGSRHETGCAYVGGGDPDVWSRGEPFDAPWFAMRGSGVSADGTRVKARAFWVFLTNDLDLRLQWPFLSDPLHARGVVVDARWKMPSGLHVDIQRLGENAKALAAEPAPFVPAPSAPAAAERGGFFKGWFDDLNAPASPSREPSRVESPAPPEPCEGADEPAAESADQAAPGVEAAEPSAVSTDATGAHATNLASIIEELRATAEEDFAATPVAEPELETRLAPELEAPLALAPLETELAPEIEAPLALAPIEPEPETALEVAPTLTLAPVEPEPETALEIAPTLTLAPVEPEAPAAPEREAIADDEATMPVAPEPDAHPMKEITTREMLAIAEESAATAPEPPATPGPPPSSEPTPAAEPAVVRVAANALEPSRPVPMGPARDVPPAGRSGATPSPESDAEARPSHDRRAPATATAASPMRRRATDKPRYLAVRNVTVVGVVLVLFAIGWWVGSGSARPRPRASADSLVQRWMSAVGLAPARCRIALASNPAGASIAVDGRALKQRTPTEIVVAPGSHSLTLWLPDLGRWDTTIEGVAGDRIPIEVALTGSLRVLAPDAVTPISVTVDGEPRGFLPVRVTGVTPGIHELEYSTIGQPTWEQTVRVPIRGAVEVTAQPLRLPPTGVIEVRSLNVESSGTHEVSGAAVWIDGERRGETPVLLELPRGPHSVRAELHGEASAVQVIDLPGGNQRYARFTFGRGVPAPRLTFISDGAHRPDGAPRTITMVVEGLPAREVREFWLHVGTPDGAWKRYPITIVTAGGQLAGSIGFPAPPLGDGDEVRYYASALCVTGDEYFSDIALVRGHIAGASSRASRSPDGAAGDAASDQAPPATLPPEGPNRVDPARNDTGPGRGPARPPVESGT